MSSDRATLIAPWQMAATGIDAERGYAVASAQQPLGQGAESDLQFPIGGKARERRVRCRSGEIPGPTVTVRMEEGVQSNTSNHHVHSGCGRCLWSCLHN